MAKNLDVIEERLKAIADLVDHGSVPEARREILRLCRKSIPRKFASELAHCARRADLPDKALALLHPYVRPPRGTIVVATDREKARYAQALTELGAINEATELLYSLKGSPDPNVYFGRALNHVKSWDWEGAIPHFQETLRHPKTVQAAATKTWLGAAYMYGPGNYQRSRIYLDEAIRETSEVKFRFVHKRALQFMIEACFLMRDWASANKVIDKLERLAREEDNAYYASVCKLWRVLTSVFNPRDQRYSIDDITSAREYLFANEKWEEARSCDYYRAVYTRDRDLLVHLYFGTSLVPLRKKLEKMLGGADRIPESYLWVPDRKSKPKHYLDVLTGENDVSKARLKHGQYPQKMLALLCSDFYRPMRLPQLHEALHPGDYFNPITSPDRIHQTLRRLREWIDESRLPLTILEINGFYRVQTTNGLAIKLFRDPEAQALKKPKAPSDVVTKSLDKLRAKFKTELFSAQDAAELLKVSYRSAVGYLKTATETGVTIKQGAGPATRYRFARAKS